MKKLLFILLSVVLVGSVGNGANKQLNTEVTDVGSTEVVKVTEEPITEIVTVETEESEIVVPKSTEAVKETVSSDEKTDTGKEKPSQQKASKDETADNKQMDENKSSENQKKKEQPEDTKSEPVSEKETKPEETAKQKEEPEKKKAESKPQAVSYSPDNVVSLAISKCQAGGMVTTEQNLLDNLNEGNITQVEYDEYYPLDGLEDSYYSVFVNVDLNKAATTSGRLLGSEEAIAQHIADMLLLESGTVFNIRYTGTTKTSGETFYEFRCYR